MKISLKSKQMRFYQSSGLDVEICAEGCFLWLYTNKRPQEGLKIGGFHLHILVFPFVYQFHSRIEAVHHLQMTSSDGFQHHFKICLLWLLHEKECSFHTYLFCLSVQVPFELPIQISIQLLLELEVN